MDKSENKREVPPTLRKILAVDAYLTEQFVGATEKCAFLDMLRDYCKTLEISCHGIPWLACWMAFIWILDSKSMYQMQVNFFLGLLLDIFIIAILKSIVRRRRPTAITDLSGIGPDKYSFPSGHASRSTFIVYFFIYLWPLHFICIPLLLAWCASVCATRLLFRKHYLLDVGAGVIVGLLLGMFMQYIYLSEQTCRGLIYWLTDEKLEGGEYHV